MVLATDMSYHFTQLKTIKNMISLNETIDKPKALSLLLHCADISHPGKRWHLHEKWSYLLVQEFFTQVSLFQVVPMKPEVRFRDRFLPFRETKRRN